MSIKLSRKNIAIACGSALVGFVLLAISFAPSGASAASDIPSTIKPDCPSGFTATNVNSGIPDATPAWTCIDNNNPSNTNPGTNGNNAAAPADGCSITDAGSWSLCVSNVVYLFTVGLMSPFAYIGAYIFSFAVQMTLQSSSYSLAFITSGWAAVRDIANMAFIFILIYIAITIILQADTTSTMKTLAWVIVMALLINFSFFITRVVIDAGNVVAVQFYNAIPFKQTVSTTAAESTLANSGAGAIVSNWLPGTTTKDLTFNMMDMLKLQSLFGTQSFAAWANAKSANGRERGFIEKTLTLSFIYIAAGFMLAMLACAFLTIGFKFIMRIIVLWFVIMAAPLAFAARAFGINKTAHDMYNQWQDALIKFAFYPAIFLFIFLFINLIMQQVGCPTKECEGIAPAILDSLNNTNADLVTNLATAVANVGIRMGLLLAMLYYGLKVADYIVLQGSGFAQQATNWASGKVTGWARPGRMYRGVSGFPYRKGVGYGYRNLIGRPTNWASKKIEGSRWANEPGLGGWFGTGLRKRVLNPVADTGLGRMRSRTQLLKDRDTQEKEWKANLKKRREKLRDSENAGLVDKISTLDDLQKSRLRNLTTRDLMNIGKDDKRTTRILALISNGLIAQYRDSGQKKIDELLKNEELSDADKQVIGAEWEKHSTTTYTQRGQTSVGTGNTSTATGTGTGGAAGAAGGGRRSSTNPVISPAAPNQQAGAPGLTNTVIVTNVPTPQPGAGAATVVAGRNTGTQGTPIGPAASSAPEGLRSGGSQAAERMVASWGSLASTDKKLSEPNMVAPTSPHRDSSPQVSNLAIRRAASHTEQPGKSPSQTGSSNPAPTSTPHSIPMATVHTTFTHTPASAPQGGSPSTPTSRTIGAGGPPIGPAVSSAPEGLRNTNSPPPQQAVSPGHPPLADQASTATQATHVTPPLIKNQTGSPTTTVQPADISPATSDSPRRQTASSQATSSTPNQAQPPASQKPTLKLWNVPPTAQPHGTDEEQLKALHKLERTAEKQEGHLERIEDALEHPPAASGPVASAPGQARQTLRDKLMGTTALNQRDVTNNTTTNSSVNIHAPITNTIHVTAATPRSAGGRVSRLTQEGRDLLATIDAGGVSSQMTGNLRRILLDNGVSQADIDKVANNEKTLAELLQQLRDVQA